MLEAERSVDTSAPPSRRPDIPAKNIQRITSPIEPTTEFRPWVADLTDRTYGKARSPEYSSTI